MNLSTGKSLKLRLQMSVKAVLTSSLMSGRTIAKPGFQVKLITRSSMRSAKVQYKIHYHSFNVIFLEQCHTMRCDAALDYCPMNLYDLFERSEISP